MRKTQIIEVFANIRATLVSFFSILMFVALGVAVFLGLQWASTALASSFDKTFAECNYHDILIKSPIGFAEEDIQELKQVQGVTSIETGYASTAQASLETGVVPIAVQSIPNTMDQLIVKAGEAPTTASQIAVMEHWAVANNINVGDTLALVANGNDADGMRDLTRNAFEVSALVESTEYLCKDSSTYGSLGGSVSSVAFVTPDAFDKSSFSFLMGAPYLYVRCSGTEGLSTFSDAYDNKTDDVADRLNDKASELITEHLSGVHDFIKSAIDVIDKAVTTAESQYKRVMSAEKDIRNKVSSGKLSKAEGKKQIDALHTQINKLCKEVNKEVASACDTLGVPKPPKLDYTTLADYLKELRDIVNDSQNLSFEVMGQRVTLAQIPDFIDNLTNAFKKNGRNAFTLDRAHNGGLLLATMLMDILYKLRFTMASLFVIVGLLVCYSAISRIVGEHIVQIGIKKALGIFVHEITASYLVYAGLSVVLGVLVGVAVAALVVQGIVNPALSNLFLMGRYPAYLSATDTLLVGGVELALILAATWFSCRAMLKKRTIELLAGVTPPTAKQRFYESWGLWKRLSLFGQIIVNNCVNEKRRVAATLIGVAGCTSLIVCAITLNDNVIGSFDAQYSTIYGFDALVQFDPASRDAQHTIEDKLSKQGLAHAPVYRKSCALLAHNKIALSTLFVPTNVDEFNKLYHILPTDGSVADLSKDGAWLGMGFAGTSGLKVGDKVEITDSTGQTSQVPILGFFRHHLITVDVVMSPQAYKDHFGTKAVANALLVDTGDQSLDDVSKSLAKTHGFLGLRNDKQLNSRAFTKFSKLSRTVVLVYLALSALMAAIVLLNLDVMYVNEKKRELIVLMICGYSVKKAKSYIRADTIVLTVLGIILGILLGVLVGNATVVSVEPPNVVFLHGIDARACLAGAVATLVFSLTSGFVALRRIAKFNLTDLSRV